MQTAESSPDSHNQTLPPHWRRCQDASRTRRRTRGWAPYERKTRPGRRRWRGMSEPSPTDIVRCALVSQARTVQIATRPRRPVGPQMPLQGLLLIADAAVADAQSCPLAYAPPERAADGIKAPKRRSNTMTITSQPQHHHRGAVATESEPPTYPENTGLGTFATGESDPSSIPGGHLRGDVCRWSRQSVNPCRHVRRWTGRSASLPSGRARRDIRRYGASRHKRPVGRALIRGAGCGLRVAAD